MPWKADPVRDPWTVTAQRMLIDGLGSSGSTAAHTASITSGSNARMM